MYNMMVLTGGSGKQEEAIDLTEEGYTSDTDESEESVQEEEEEEDRTEKSTSIGVFQWQSKISGEGAVFEHHDVSDDGNCFFYAILRATFEKGIDPGVSLLGQGFQNQQAVFVGEDIEVPSTEKEAMVNLRKHISTQLSNYRDLIVNNGNVPETRNYLYFNQYINLVYTERVQKLNAMIKNIWDYGDEDENNVGHAKWIDDAIGICHFIQCIYGAKIRLFTEIGGDWLVNKDVDPQEDHTVNLYHTGEHYQWLNWKSGSPPEKNKSSKPPPAKKRKCYSKTQKNNRKTKGGGQIKMSL
jgi:hypothetical protein